jgi:hypothetical protein
MSKMRVLELLPFFTMIAIVAIVSSTVLATAGFAFPDLFGKWSFGQPASAAPGTVTTVQKASLPLGDLTMPAGLKMPFGGMDLFRSPMTSVQKYTRTYMTPDGPETQAAERAYDPGTGLWTTTVNNL